MRSGEGSMMVRLQGVDPPKPTRTKVERGYLWCTHEDMTVPCTNRFIATRDLISDLRSPSSFRFVTSLDDSVRSFLLGVTHKISLSTQHTQDAFAITVHSSTYSSNRGTMSMVEWNGGQTTTGTGLQVFLLTPTTTRERDARKREGTQFTALLKVKVESTVVR